VHKLESKVNHRKNARSTTH